MDVVVQECLRKHWGILNYCRRYLRVVTLADLFLHDASRIHPDFLRGRRPVGRHVHYMWPDIPAPTKSCIALWKGFLTKYVSRYQDKLSEDDWLDLELYSHSLPFYYHFGSATLYQHGATGHWEKYPCFPGSRSLRGMVGKCSLVAEGSVAACPEGAVPVEVEQAPDAFVVLAVSSRHLASFRFQQRSDEPAEGQLLLVERFDALPPLLRRLCGKVEVPEDGGAALANYVRETGRKLFGVSDGSAKTGLGMYGWRLCRFPGDELALMGSGFVDGDGTTPFRAESQGQLAILIASSVLVEKWSFNMLEVMSICDNKAVLRRLAKAHRDRRLADNKDPDAGLYEVYRAWVKRAPVRCSYRWVKGHQDRDGVYEELSAEAKINCEVDRSAGLFYDRKDIPQRDVEIPTFPQEVYGVYTQNGKITRGLRKGVLAQSGREEMEAYYAGKYGMSEGKREGIHWEGFESLLRAHKPHQRAMLVKYQNGWLPTNDFLHRQGRAASSLCPLCGLEKETSQHVSCCANPGAVAYRSAKLRDCMRQLREAGTAPEIINCWDTQLHRLMGLQQLGQHDLSASRHNASLEAAVAEARKHQALLSWEGLLRGRLSNKWGGVQALHQRLRREAPRKGLPWSQRSVRIVGAVVLELWKYRNEKVHGASVQEAKLLRRQRVNALVVALFRRNPTLLPRFQSVRAVPLATRLVSPVEVLHVWLQQVARQEQVTGVVRAKAAVKSGSILRFLALRRQTAAAGSEEVATGRVFDRGK